jgi:signal transduction histidine kinase
MTAVLWIGSIASAGLLGWAVSHWQAQRALNREIARCEAAEAALRRLKGELVGAASHKLRTPLTAIGGFIELVAEEEAGPINARQREFLEIAAQNTRRLSGILDDLLGIEKPSPAERQGEEA